MAGPRPSPVTLGVLVCHASLRAAGPECVFERRAICSIQVAGPEGRKASVRRPVSSSIAMSPSESSNSTPQNTSPQKYKQLGLSTSGPEPSDTDDAQVDFSAIWGTLRRRKWVVLVTCLLVTAAVAGYTLTLPKVYESTSMVSVGATPAMQSTEVWPSGEGGIELSKEIGLLENSGKLNQRVVERLSAVADTASVEALPLFRPVEGEEPTTQEVISRLRDRTAFTGRPDQGMIEIEASSSVPEEAAYIVNAFAEEYRQFSREMARSGVTAAREFLEEQVKRRRQELRAVEQEWKQFALENDIATEGESGERVAQEYVELRGKRDALEFELEQEQRMRSTLQRQLSDMQSTLRGSVVAEQRVQSLRTQIQTLQEELSRLRMKAEQFYTNNPSLEGNEEQVPELAALKERIKQHEERKNELTENLVSMAGEQGMAMGAEAGGGAIGQLETLRARIEERTLNIQQLKEQIQGIDQEIATYEGQIDNIPQQTIRRQQIQRRLDQAEEFYQQVASELQQTTIAEESQLGYVDVVRAGVIPQFPVRPNLHQNILLGLLLGLGFGVGMAFIVQTINARIYEPSEIQHQGYNLLGVVPEMDDEIEDVFNGDETVEVAGRTLSTTLLPLLNPWSTVTENYRLMRTNLQYPHHNGEERKSPEVLLVTSPEPGDGKTTTAANLALTFALSGHEVLFIDGDLRRSNAHNLMGLEAEPGLSDILSGKKSLDEVTQTFIEDLRFVAAGESKAPPAEMLDSKRMRSLMEEARSKADVVIFDSPPVLSASDALILGVQADASLVVASAGATDRKALQQVEKTFGGVGVPLSAIIFNRFESGSGYDYGYEEEYYKEYPELVTS